MPEEVGRQAARALFEEISRGGVVDSAHQVPELDLPWPIQRGCNGLARPEASTSRARLARQL